LKKYFYFLPAELFKRLVYFIQVQFGFVSIIDFPLAKAVSKNGVNLYNMVQGKYFWERN